MRLAVVMLPIIILVLTVPVLVYMYIGMPQDAE